MTIWLCLLVLIVGAALYLLSAHPKRQMLGLIAYGVGLLVFLQTVGPKLLSLFGGR
jgi:Na+/phosphate symporter